jgi:hypothetical protein
VGSDRIQVALCLGVLLEGPRKNLFLFGNMADRTGRVLVFDSRLIGRGEDWLT